MVSKDNIKAVSCQGYACPQDFSSIAPQFYYFEKLFNLAGNNKDQEETCFDLGRKALQSIIRTLKWVPFKECLVATPTTLFTLICVLTPSAPATGPEILTFHSNWRHCHSLHHHTLPLLGCVNNPGPGLGIQRPEGT